MKHYMEYRIEREQKKSANILTRLNNSIFEVGIFEVGIFAAISLPALIVITA